MEEARVIDRDDVGEIFRRVFDERLGDEDAGIVDQRIHAAEALDRGLHNPLCDGRIRYVPGHRHEIRLVARPDRAGIRDHAIAALPETFDQTRADALRSAGDDRNLPFRAHGLASFLKLWLERQVISCVIRYNAWNWEATIAKKGIVVDRIDAMRVFVTALDERS